MVGRLSEIVNIVSSKYVSTMSKLSNSRRGIILYLQMGPRICVSHHRC